MKIKPLYIYAIVTLIATAVIVFVVLQDDNSVKQVTASADIMNKEMPKDNIHKGLTNPNQQAPSKNNVMENIKHEMDMMKKAVEENPKDTLKMRQYADLMGAAHQKDVAVQYYNKILKIDPKRTDIMFSLSYVYYMNHDLDNAEKMMKKVLNRDNSNLQAYYNLGVIAATKGDKDKAKEIWNKLIKDYPNSKEAGIAKSSISRL